MKLKSFLLSFFLSTAVVAAEAPRHAIVGAYNSSGSSVLLNACALNGTCSFSLKTASVAGYAYLVLYHFFDYSANAGTITTTCTASKEGQVFQPTVCAISGGTCTLSMAGTFVTGSLGADTRFYVPVGVLGASDITCTVTHGGTPGASEKITVYGDLVSQ